MRLDRLLSLTKPTVSSDHSGRPIAILMYHSVSNRTENKRHPYFKTVTHPVRFSEQMGWLAEAGAEVVALESWNKPYLQKGSFRVIITFDDGFADFASNAFPILRHYGYPATVFLPTAYIGTGKELIPGVKHLQWDEVERLSMDGVQFGSHTANHRSLEKLSGLEIREEVQNSAESIQNHIGGKVTSFSCPFAFPQAHPAAISALNEALLDSGYKVAVTTKIGTVSPEDDPLSLRRLPVNTDDDQSLFMAKLGGGYDWLGGIQTLARRTKKVFNL